MAADSIEELLHQDEVDGHNDALRRDLNALTEEQWQYYFKVERKQPDIELGGQLIVRESEERPHVLYIWVAAMVAGFGMMIGAIQASHYLSYRRLCKTIIALPTFLTYHRPRRWMLWRATACSAGGDDGRRAPEPAQHTSVSATRTSSTVRYSKLSPAIAEQSRSRDF
jgi:hypothetical protein